MAAQAQGACLPALLRPGERFLPHGVRLLPAKSMCAIKPRAWHRNLLTLEGPGPCWGCTGNKSRRVHSGLWTPSWERKHRVKFSSYKESGFPTFREDSGSAEPPKCLLLLLFFFKLSCEVAALEKKDNSQHFLLHISCFFL